MGKHSAKGLHHCGEIDIDKEWKIASPLSICFGYIFRSQYQIRRRFQMRMKVLFVLLFFYYGCKAQNAPEVQTNLGRVRGYLKTSLEGRKYAAFEGIPYAKPPIGDLRFEDPEEVEPWKGVWDGTKSYHCYQVGLDFFPVTDQGSEDCLFINVYVPLEKLGQSENLDVIFHIHGGAFMLGSGLLMSPDVLMDRDLVFVSFNYRLGIFGFLGSGDGVIEGNFGMKDQVEALKWVQKHISSFNGNPNSVTITGVSAGGASVHLHFFSPLSKGLFHRAFSESGAALNPWVLQDNPKQNAKKLASLVGCDNDSFKYIKACLKKRPAHLLMSKLPHFYEYDNFPFSPFAPIVDAVGENRFLPNHPIAKYSTKTVIDVPWLVCTASEEGIFPGIWVTKYINELNEIWPKLAPFLLDYNHTTPKSQWGKIAEDIKQHYLGGEDFREDNFKRVIQMLSDRIFVHGTELSSILQSKANKSPVYYYIFNYENIDHSFFDIPGVAHGAGSTYLHGTVDRKWSETDKQIINLLLDMLVNFAKTGVPKISNVDWKPVQGNSLTYLNITSPTDIKLQTEETLSSRDFWKTLNILENEKVVIVKDEL